MHSHAFNVNQLAPARASCPPTEQQLIDMVTPPSHPREVTALEGKPEPSMKVRGCSLGQKSQNMRRSVRQLRGAAELPSKGRQWRDNNTSKIVS